MEQAVSGQTTRQNRTVVLFPKLALTSACIGVFDSGVGGLTVAASLRRALPGVPLHYLADSSCAPYGEKDASFIQARSLQIAQHLRERGARLLVIACNTATALAAEAIRAAHPEWPVVGIEPGVKPAVAASRSGRVGVLATAATVQSLRFRQLIERHASNAQITTVACSGVAARIERGDLQSEALRALVAEYCRPLREAAVDTALLGCTHYPLIRPLWQEHLPGVRLLQVEDAVARHAARQWADATPGDPAVTLTSSGDPQLLGRLAREALGWDGFELAMADLPPLVPGTGLEPVRPR